MFAIRARQLLAPAATVLAVAIVITWLAVSLLQTGRIGTLLHNQSLLRYGGVTAATLERGEWWRLVSSQFLHVYLLHALLNAAAVLAVGSSLERLIGTRAFLITYFAGGCAGQLCLVGIAPAIVASGASQAATCIAAAALLLSIRRAQRHLLIMAGAYLAIQLVLDVAFAGTVKLPHLVSFVTGLAFGSWWHLRLRTRHV